MDGISLSQWLWGVVTHGWGPATATRFMWMLHVFRGLYPSRGLHLRLGSEHRDAVRLVVLRFPWVTPIPWVAPTVGVLPPLCPWVVTHGWGPITAAWFRWDLPPRRGSIGWFALFRHQFEEHGGAVFKCRGINGYGGFAITFGKRKLLPTCTVEAESV